MVAGFQNPALNHSGGYPPAGAASSIAGVLYIDTEEGGSGSPNTIQRAQDSAFYLLSRCVTGEHSLNVFGQNIELDVHQIARLDAVDVGVTLGMRDDPGGQIFLQELCDGETDSIDCNGAFVGRVM